MAISDLGIRVLEFAERREQNPGLPSGQTVVELGLSPTRYAQILMHLVETDEVVSDPRWTGMAHRIQRVMSGAAEMRSERRFTRAS